MQYETDSLAPQEVLYVEDHPTSAVATADAVRRRGDALLADA